MPGEIRRSRGSGGAVARPECGARRRAPAGIRAARVPEAAVQRPYDQARHAPGNEQCSHREDEAQQPGGRSRSSEDSKKPWASSNSPNGSTSTIPCCAPPTCWSRRLTLSVRALTYRLERIHKLTGANPADPAHRYMLQTAVIGARLLDWPAKDL